MTKKKKHRGTGQSMDNQEVLQEETEVLMEEAAELEQAEAAGAVEEAEVLLEQDDLQGALAAAQAKQEEYLTMAQRVQADFENFRRRNQNVRKEAYDDGASHFATTMLPVLDNIERALGAAQDSADASLKEGVEMVYRQFLEVFTKHGIATIDRKGELFDPNLENAVMRSEPGEGEPGTVAEVLQKGYQMGSIVLRYAMVKVVPE